MAILKSSGKRHSWLRALWLVLLSWPCMGVTSLGAQPTFGEHELKAAYLFHFTKFVEWPAAAFAGPDAPLCLGVLGDVAVATALEKVANGQKVAGRKLVAKRVAKLDEIKGCHLLYVGPLDKKAWEETLAALAGQSILIVGESEEFTRRGGVIRFYPEKESIRFEINPDAAGRAKLKISAQLLKLARIVRDPPNGRIGSGGIGSGDNAREATVFYALAP